MSILNKSNEVLWDELIGVRFASYAIVKMNYTWKQNQIEKEFLDLLPMLEKMEQMDELERISFKASEIAIKERLNSIKEETLALNKKAEDDLEKKLADEEAAYKEAEELLLQFDEILKTLEPAREYFKKLLDLNKRGVQCLSPAYNPFLSKKGFYVLFSEKSMKRFKYIGEKHVEDVESYFGG